MATHSSILAWRIPGTVEPDGLPSMWSQAMGGGQGAPLSPGLEGTGSVGVEAEELMLLNCGVGEDS